MQKTIAVVLAVCVLAISCKKPAGAGTASLRLQLNPMFGGMPMRLGSTYSTPDGRYYYFNYFAVTLSHIRLIHADGSYVEVNAAAYINLNDSTEAMPVVSLTNIAGTYTAVRFSIGLDSVQDNTLDNGDPSSPFYANLYWGASLKYVFLELDGLADTSRVPLNGISYLIGSKAYYTTITLSKPFTLTANSPETIVLNMDLRSVFYGGANPINALDPAQDVTGNPVNAPVAQKFITNMDASFSLQ
jgi:hypothetical protein